MSRRSVPCLSEWGRATVPGQDEADQFPQGRDIFRSYFVRPGREFGLQGGPMNQSILTINGLDISLGMATAAFTAAVLALLVIIAAIGVRAFGRRDREIARQMRQGEAMESRIAELARLQAETVGRLQALGEGLGGRQAELARVMAERLDAVSSRLGHSMDEVTQQTVQRLQSLHERLAVIDHAHKSLADLSGQVTSLRDVLGN